MIDTLDSDTPDATFTYTPLGRQNVVTQSGIATWTFDYDDGETGEGNTLRLVSEAIAGTGGFYSKTITRDYEGSGTGQLPGRDAGFHIGSDYEVNYYYDNAGSGGQLTGTGRFKRITGPGLPTYGVQYSYTANSDLLSIWKFKTGSDDSTTVAAVSRGYESNRDLPTSVSNWASGTPGTFSTYTYGYDELGRRKSVVNGGTQFSPAELNKWGYNPKSELVWSYRHEGSNPDQPGTEITAERRLYTYDQIGNRQDTTVGNSSTPTLRYCADDLNRYNQTYTGSQQTCPVASPAESFAYDDDGNLTQDGTFNYTWDAENRLKSVTPRNPTPGAKKVRFVYDYMGRRVEKAVYTYNNGWPENPGEVQRFVYDGWNVVLVLDGNNVTQRKYTWGLDLSGTIHGAGGIGGLLAAVETQGTTGEEDDQRYWFFYDANGNVGQVLDTTNTSNITIAAHYEYDPYGNVIGPDDDADGDWRDDATPYALANPIRFSTKWYDVETDMYYFGYRYYLSRLGRWGSADPMGERGGLNLVAFGVNNPIGTLEPLGLKPVNTPDEARRLCSEEIIEYREQVKEGPLDKPCAGGLKDEMECGRKFLSLFGRNDEATERLRKINSQFSKECPAPSVCCRDCQKGYGGWYVPPGGSPAITPGALVKICWNNVKSDEKRLIEVVTHEFTHALQQCYRKNSGRSDCSRSLHEEMETYYCAGQCTKFEDCLGRAIGSACGIHCVWSGQISDRLFDELKEYFAKVKDKFCTFPREPDFPAPKKPLIPPVTKPGPQCGCGGVQ